MTPTFHLAHPVDALAGDGVTNKFTDFIVVQAGVFRGLARIVAGPFEGVAFVRGAPHVWFTGIRLTDITWNRRTNSCVSSMVFLTRALVLTVGIRANFVVARAELLALARVLTKKVKFVFRVWVAFQMAGARSGSANVLFRTLTSSELTIAQEAFSARTSVRSVCVRADFVLARA